jgi:hypothetical protein
MQQIASKKKVALPGLPAQSAIEDQMLRVLSSRPSPVRMTALYNILAEKFGLTRSERYGNPFLRKGSGWEYLVRHAKRHLVTEGWLHCPNAGLLAPTPMGRDEAQKRQSFSANRR